jgi:hypothetical protein
MRTYVTLWVTRWSVPAYSLLRKCFNQPLPRNGRLFRFHYSTFQASCHNKAKNPLPIRKLLHVHNISITSEKEAKTVPWLAVGRSAQKPQVWNIWLSRRCLARAVSAALLWQHYSGFQTSCHMSHIVCLYGTVPAFSSSSIILAFRQHVTCSMFIWYCNGLLFCLHYSGFQELGGGDMQPHKQSDLISLLLFFNK